MTKYREDVVPHEVRRRVLSVCRDQRRLKNIAKRTELRISKTAEEKVSAYEETLKQYTDQERYVIKQHIIRRVPMIYIDTRLSVATMKRIKNDFIINVAEKLGEI